MGINGLLPFLKKASRPAHVREFSGSTVGVDVYGWMHKGAFGCAEKLVKGESTDGYIFYVMKYVDLLIHHRIKPVLVFDGRNLPSKSQTEKKRRENREKYRKLAKDYLRDGRLKEARECFQRCVDITPKMARDVIQACHERKIDCIVAPYEADAQLAFLNRSGLVDFIISEDSDLTTFDCDKILFKLDINGNGILYEKSNLHLCFLGNFSFEKFRRLCIMSGCDYLPSIHGIGLAKSLKFWSSVTNRDLDSVLPKIPTYLKMPQIEVTDEYIQGFKKAEETFLYQIVFDPKTRKLRPLTDYEGNGENGDSYPYAGEFVDSQLALQMALGNVDLKTLEKIHNFDPDDSKKKPVIKKCRFGTITSHKSIWASDFDPKFEIKPKKKAFESTKGRELLVNTAFAGTLLDAKKRKSEESGIPNSNNKQRKSEESGILNGNKQRKSEESEIPNKRMKIDESSEIIEDEVPNQNEIVKVVKNDESSEIVRDDEKEKLYTQITKHYEPPEVVVPKTVISKYFTNSGDKKSKKRRGGGGEWLSALDEVVNHEDKLIYNTQLETNLGCSPAVRQPFKQVVVQGGQVQETSVKKRNPFIKSSPKVAPSGPKMVLETSDPKAELENSDPKVALDENGSPETELENGSPKVELSGPKVALDENGSPKTELENGDHKVELENSDPKVALAENSSPKVALSDPKTDELKSQTEISPHSQGQTSIKKRNPFIMSSISPKTVLEINGPKMEPEIKSQTAVVKNLTSPHCQSPYFRTGSRPSGLMKTKTKNRQQLSVLELWDRRKK